MAKKIKKSKMATIKAAIQAAKKAAKRAAKSDTEVDRPSVPINSPFSSSGPYCPEALRAKASSRRDRQRGLCLAPADGQELITAARGCRLFRPLAELSVRSRHVRLVPETDY